MTRNNIVRVDGLYRSFKVPVREAGIKAAFRSLFFRRYDTVHAVKPISFNIKKGEIVGFLGPNGAGKTTTIKMLSGLIYPTGGTVEVAGFCPQKRENDYLKQIAVLMGNRSRLQWNIPVVDSFLFYQHLYDIPEESFNKRLGTLLELMDVENIVQKPVRNLSLGQRMKCEFILALLHNPKVLFLDEPTLGLDINAQNALRNFIRECNQREASTVFITSHNMQDIEFLCHRVIIIHKGEIIYDGTINELKRVVTNEKNLRVEFIGDQKSLITKLDDFAIANTTENTLNLTVNRENIKVAIEQLVKLDEIVDIEITELPIETIIERVFAQGYV